MRTKARPLRWDAMEAVIREDLGERAEALLTGLDREPIAAASIGQVYRGVLDDGRQIAAKVQYPGIAEAVRSDLKNADTLVAAMSVVLPQVDVEQTLADISARVLEECDYEHELRSQRELRDFWSGDAEAYVPRVHEDLSGRRVLVSELIHGASFAQMMERTGPAERDRLGRIMARFAFRSLYVRGAAGARRGSSSRTTSTRASSR